MARRPAKTAVLVLGAILLAIAASGADAELTQRGDLFVSFNGAISPSALPRRTLAPISVGVEGRIRVLSGDHPPALRRIVLQLNRAGHLDTTGLPVCPPARVRATSTAEARSACRSALIGEGSFAAASSFPEQSPTPTRGHILAFNSRSHGHPAILAHIYGRYPLPSSRLFFFRLYHRASGPYGIVLRAYLSPSLNPHGYLKRIALRLHRTFAYHGRTASYLSAACAAPPGFPLAIFPLARASMSFADGRTLSSTLTRSCRVRR